MHNNRFQSTLHKVSGPLNRDVGLKYMRPLTIIFILLCLWTCGCTTVLSEKERSRLSEVLVEDHMQMFLTAFPQFKTNQNMYVAIGLTPDRKWIPPSSNLIRRLQKQGFAAVSVKGVDDEDISSSRGCVFYSNIKWDTKEKRYEWESGRAISPDNFIDGCLSGYLERIFFKWRIRY